MKVKALKEHKCFCCDAVIEKGEECFASFVNPSDAQKSEFDVIYTCSKCIREESCRTKIERRNTTAS